ncbi:tRNA (adenosine(37)-N6)-dimethylallyltransferase MiaA [Patescibacteria group bacterium]|nr:tRNA (adenosine(37)-N6)-dimethylallyltransferase MiaA [Patescibacteria group bacterium]
MDLLKDLTSFVETAKKPLVVILGPTAAGKTAISLKIAKHINGEIISTDSRQIYKYMDIATDVISPQEQDNIPHHLLTFAEPDQLIDMATYKNLALKKIEEIYSRKHIPMLVGGTGLYISAIIEGYNLPSVPPNPKLRLELEQQAKNEGKESVHDILKKLDPKSAEKIHPNNLRYTIRAIEIAKSGQKPNQKQKSPFDLFTIGLTLPREELYEKINNRVDQQKNSGLLEEVQNLTNKGYDENLPSMTSLGVKEIIPYLRGEMPLENCLETLKQNTRHYAKRQLTWLKRYDNVNWLSKEDVQEILNK